MNDGACKWRYSIESPLSSSTAIVADGTAYIASNDGKLYAINPNGRLKWNYATESNLYSSPVIGADGTVYIASDDGNLYAINPDGRLKWSYTIGGYLYSSPVIGADGAIYIASDDGKLYAIKSTKLMDAVMHSPASCVELILNPKAFSLDSKGYCDLKYNFRLFGVNVITY